MLTRQQNNNADGGGLQSKFDLTQTKITGNSRSNADSAER